MARLLKDAATEIFENDGQCAIFGRHPRGGRGGAAYLGKGALGQDALDRDAPRAKEEIHSAASARSLNGKSSRCQTSTRASASVSIKTSS
jgi:hypothetical protein